jgi:hypothetical protein
MEIDKLVSLVTKQVKERLDAFENRKKVLLLGDCESVCLENLCNAFESSGFKLCDADEKEQDLDNYEFIVISKSKFRDMLQKVKSGTDAGKAEGTAAVQPAADCRIDKRIITEQDIQKLIREGCREIKVGRKTIITPLALDALKVGSIRVVRE